MQFVNVIPRLKWASFQNFLELHAIMKIEMLVLQICGIEISQLLQLCYSTIFKLYMRHGHAHASSSRCLIHLQKLNNDTDTDGLQVYNRLVECFLLYQDIHSIKRKYLAYRKCFGHLGMYDKCGKLENDEHLMIDP